MVNVTISSSTMDPMGHSHTRAIPTFIELDDGKNYRKALYLMVKTMVSCNFSLKPIQWVIAFAFSDGLCQNLCLPSSNRDTTYTRAHWQCVEYTVVQVCSITQSTNRTVPSVTPLGCRGTTNRVAWLRIRAPSHGKVSREWVYHSCHSSDLEGQQ